MLLYVTLSRAVNYGLPVPAQTETLQPNLKEKLCASSRTTLPS